MREPGLYWVRIRSVWTVAYWNSDTSAWWLPGNESKFNDSDLFEIDERRIVREEPTE